MENLKKLRKKIDKTDGKLLKILAERFSLLIEKIFKLIFSQSLKDQKWRRKERFLKSH